MNLEDQRWFSIAPQERIDNINLTVACGRCGAEIVCCGLATLADLVSAADEHAEECS